MNDIEKLRLDNVEYGLHKMPPTKAGGFGLRVVNILSKAMANQEALAILKMISAKFGGKQALENVATHEIDMADIPTMGMAIFKLFSSVNPVELDAIMKEGLSYEVFAEEKGKPPVRLNEDGMDNHFAKYPGHMYIVGAWAVWSHAKDFIVGAFDTAKTRIESLKNTAEAPQA